MTEVHKEDSSPNVTLLAPRHHGDIVAIRGARTAAILVCHGMGQQVPFETISGIAHSLLKLAGARVAPVVGRVQIGDQITARAEIDFPDHTGILHNIHVYEAYWAPLTEGKVTLRAVLLFLFGAGIRGIAACLKGFQFERWKFGGFQECSIKKATLPELLFALVTLASILLLYGSLVMTTPPAIAQTIGAKSNSSNATAFLRALIYSPFSLWPVLVIVIGIMRLFNHRLRSRAGQFWVVLTWIGVAAFALLLFLGGVLASHAFYIRGFNGTTWRWEELLVATSLLSYAGSIGLLLTFLWAGAAAVFIVLRYFLIEFVGDVTIYVSSFKVSVFDETRKAIQKIGRDMATLIYRAGTAGNGIAYDRVIVVGHSLGSVVAYDTLNDMIVRDSLDPTLNVSSRTAALVTFGSPLDKTAFLFRTQVLGSDGEPDAIREALAASVQPLISAANMRPQPTCGFEWTNIYSRADIISGSLEYYDDTKDSVPNVANLSDPDANIPLAAHIQYWENSTLASVLHRHIVR